MPFLFGRCVFLLCFAATFLCLFVLVCFCFSLFRLFLVLLVFLVLSLLLLLLLLLGIVAVVASVVLTATHLFVAISVFWIRVIQPCCS